MMKNYYKDNKGRYYYGNSSVIINTPVKNLTPVKDMNELRGKAILTSEADLFADYELILCNNIVDIDPYIFDNHINGELYSYYNSDGEEVNWNDDYEYEEICEIYQYYIVSERCADFLQRHTDKLLFYSDKLECYILGVSHFGTSWNMLPTSFKF